MFIVFVLPFSILIRIWCHVVIAGDSIFEIEHL